MRSLFMCAIGPVQDFIATARRSRDLWYGSWMLSELSKAAAKKVAESSLNELIFPAPATIAELEPDSDLTVPNRIVAILEGKPETAGEQVKGAVQKRLDELRTEAFDQIKGPFNERLAMEQVNSLAEIYWVSVPFEDDYPRARDQAERLMAARKVTRDFAQAMGDYVPKSSLDGARESVIPKQAYAERGDSEQIRGQKIQSLYQHYHARQGEQLSGVDLLKRLGGKAVSWKFRSTSHLAALPFLEKLGEKKEALLDEIRGLFKSSGWGEIGEQEDGALVFESRLVEWLPAGRLQEQLRINLQKILRKYAGGKSPSPYYALLAADGDNMGLVIDAQKDAEKHRALSQALVRFAQAAPKIIGANLGIPIYTGGDDVLAYLPLHNVLKCASELEKLFRKDLEEFKAFSDGDEIAPTLSIGIVIAHHLEPLADVLELARQAERRAKLERGKKGLAITLCKRAGADRTASGKWGSFDARLSQLIDLACAEAISSGTAYELLELQRVLSATTIPVEGLALEALRIIKRKKETGGKNPINQKVLDAFKTWLTVEKIALDELAKEMIIAGMFAGCYEPLEGDGRAEMEVSA